MGLNETPSAERVHIGFFGKRNAGKSSVVNRVTEQELSVVSDVKGTTTDPVKKAMELLPIGPVVIIDTPGYDDTGALGEKRVRKTKEILNRTDAAVLVIDALEGRSSADDELISLFEKKEIPYVIAWNKMDLLPEEAVAEPVLSGHHAEIYVSAETNRNIYELKELIGKVAVSAVNDRHLVYDMISEGDVLVLVIPIDSSAPKGRLILPQQMMIRDILDRGAKAVCVRETELADALKDLKNPPKLVITDSQAFKKVSETVPANVPLTSFSILMARYKGLLFEAVRGVHAVENLQDGDLVLIAEGCTHHRQCDDIGTFKIPNWLRNYTGKEIRIETCSGFSFPEDLSAYKLIIHCGGCMLNEKEVRFRMKQAVDAGIPITNYGIMIAYMNGILDRSTAVFKEQMEQE